MRFESDNKERREADRFPIEQEIRYRLLNRKSNDEFELGKTIDISSNGVLFMAGQFLVPGRRLEVAIAWPAQLNSKIALKLVARGQVVRTDGGKAAIEIQQHEFRTQGTQTLPAR